MKLTKIFSIIFILLSSLLFLGYGSDSKKQGSVKQGKNITQSNNSLEPVQSIDPESTSKKKPTIGKIKLCLSRAGENSVRSQVKNAWFSALVERYYYFRLSPVSELNLVSREKYAISIPLSDPFGIVVSEENLFSVAQNVHATHMLIHTYDFDEKAKRINYFLEIVSLADKKVIMNFDRSFAFSELGKNLDECVKSIVGIFKVSVPNDIQQMLDKPILSTDLKALQSCGEIIVEAEEQPTQKSAERIIKIVNQESGFSLAVHTAASLLNKLGSYDLSAQYYNHLIMRNGLIIPSFYVEASRNHRLSKSFDKSERVLLAAQNKGINTIELSIEIALILQQANNLLEATKIYQQILEQNPTQPDALLFMSRQARIQGAYDKALMHIATLVNTSEQLGDAFMEKGQILIAMNKYDEALVALNKAQDLKNNNPRLKVLIADVLMQKKDYANAARFYSEGLDKMSRDLETLLKTVDAFKKSKNPQSALDILNKYKQNFYDTKVVNREMGLVYFCLGDTNQARNLLEPCINLEPPDSMLFLVLGDIYSNTNQGDKAVSMYEKAEPLVADKLNIAFLLGKLYYSTRQSFRAERKFLEIYEKKSNYPLVNKYLGMILRERNQDKEALVYFLNERNFFGNNEMIQQSISEIYFKQNDLVNAEKESKKLIELYPNNPLGYFQLATIALKKKQIQDAENYIAKTENIGKVDPLLYKEFAKGLVASQYIDKAIKAYQIYLKKVVDDEAAWVELSTLLLQTKQDSLTGLAYMKIYNLNPLTNKEYLVKAGHIFYKAHVKHLAYEAYNQYVEKFGTQNSEVNFNLAEMEFDKKNHQRVITLLKHSQPGAGAAGQKYVQMMAYSYFNETNFKDAIEYLKEHSANNPLDIKSIEMRAIAYEKNGDIAQAIQMYQQYLLQKKAENRQELVYHIGTLFEQIKNTKAALTQYKQNCLSYPQDVRNYDRLVELYKNDKNYSLASETIEQVIKQPSVSYEYHKKLGQLYVLQSKKAEAVSAYEKYLKNVSNDEAVVKELGLLYFSLENYEKAKLFLSKTAETASSTPEVLIALGSSFVKTDNLRKAIAPLEKAMKSEPQNKTVLELLTRCYEYAKDTSNLVSILQSRVLIVKDSFDLHFYLGKLLKQTGKIDSATIVLETASTQKPSDLECQLALVELYKKKKDMTQRLRHIDEGLKYSPNSVSFVFEKALYYVETNDSVQGKVYLQKSLSLDPSNHIAHFYYASLVESQNNNATAYHHYNKAVQLMPKNTRYLKQLALSAMSLGKNTEALNTISQALSLDKDNQELIQTAGFLYYQSKEYKKAEEYLLAGLEGKSKCSFCNQFLGMIYYYRHEYDKSIDYLEKAMNEDPKNDSLLMTLANAFSLKKNPKKALNYYEKAYTVNQKNDEAFYYACAFNIDLDNIKEADALIKNNQKSHKSGWQYLAEARLLEANGRIALSANAYAEAQQLMPDNFDVLVGKARIELKQANYSQSLKEFSKAMSQQPDNIDVIVGLGQSYYGLNDLAAAKELFKDALEKKPDFTFGYYLLGQLYFRQEKNDEAIDIFKRGLKYESKNANIIFALGVVYERILQFEDAIDCYKKSASIDETKQIPCFEHIGLIYYSKLKKVDDAKKYFKKYIKAGGNDFKIKDLAQKL